MAEHLLTTPSCDFYLWIFRNFSEHLIYRSPPWGCLFHVQVTGFQPAYTIKNYFIGTFQAFFARTREVSVKKLIRSEAVRCKSPSLQNKLFHTHRFMSLLIYIYSQGASRLLLTKKLWKCASTLSFKKCKSKIVYLINYNLSKPTFECRMRHFPLSWVRFLSNKWSRILHFWQYIFDLRGK